MRDVVQSYDSRAERISRPAVRECLDVLMNSVRGAVEQHDRGVFIDQQYVVEHYSGEISDFRQKYSALSEEDKTYARNLVGVLSEYYKLMTIRDYFGVSIESLL